MRRTFRGGAGGGGGADSLIILEDNDGKTNTTQMPAYAKAPRALFLFLKAECENSVFLLLSLLSFSRPYSSSALYVYRIFITPSNMLFCKGQFVTNNNRNNGSNNIYISFYANQQH